MVFRFLCLRSAAVKILPLLAAVSTLAVTATANTNSTSTVRYITFTATGVYGLAENPDVDGVAMVRLTGAGWSRVQVMVNGLQPSRSYGVKVGEALVSPYGLQTRPSGTGHFTGEFVGPIFPENPAIQIFIYDGDEEEVWYISPEEIRAVATPI